MSNILINPYRFGLADAEVSYISSATHAVGSANTSHTFASQSIGTAAADRYVIVGVGSNWAGSNSRSHDSVTIGGVTATQVANLTSTNATASIYSAAVASGTTGDIVVNRTAGTADWYLGVIVWRGIKLSSGTTATDTVTGNTQTVSGNIDVDAGGILMGLYVGTPFPSTTTVSWTGLTEDASINPETYTTVSGASAEYAVAQSALAVEADATAFSSAACVIASMR